MHLIARLFIAAAHPVRRALALGALAALGVSAASPVAGQQPPTFLPTCTAGESRVEGVVVDRATRVPLAGASVELTVGESTRRSMSTVEGLFRFCSVPPRTRGEVRATYSAVASPPLSVVGADPGEPVLLEIDLGLPSNIIISVTDTESGQPVEGVTLRLQPGIISGVTNESGRAGLGRVPPGDYRLLADHLAYTSFAGSVFIDPDRPRQLDIALSPQIIAMDTLNVMIEAGECVGPGRTTVSGRVVDRRTKIPLRDAVVSASRFGDEGFVEQRAQTGANGGFFLCGMPTDTRFRLAASLGTRQSEGINVDTGRERGAIVLEIDHGEPAFLVMRVTDGSTGFPVEGAMIRLRPHPLGGITNEKGWTGFREIPPGEYEVRVDHVAYASFEGTMHVGEESHEEYGVELQPTAISVAPIEVTITGRDPYLINNGFYDRMSELEEGYFYDFWDMESYRTLTSFLTFKTFMTGAHTIFINGRPLNRTSQRLNEIKFREIRGVEHIECRDLPREYRRYLDLFTIFSQASPCWAVLIWRGEGRVREQREKPTDRCATERRAELTCQKEGATR